jgi:Outer membrane protein beta-barrel domain
LKSLCLTLLSVLLSISIRAQTFGLRAGLNLTTQKIIYNKIEVNPPSTLRSHLNLFVNSQVAKNICFQVELGYSGLGFSEDKKYGLKETKYDYLVGAILLKHYPIKSLSLYFGPQFGLILRKESQLYGNPKPQDQVKPNDVFAVVGIDYFFNSVVGVGARYNWGVNNVHADSYQDLKQYNRVIQFSLLFRIPGYQYEQSGY